jgi:hypothetical protein
MIGAGQVQCIYKAEQCFEMLITKWLVYSEEVNATGRVKSCMVGDLVHDFITEIAKKQRIVETRLSHHLARHFSISNDIHLRGSERIDDFLEKLSKSSQWSRLKVLDLEGCQCFKSTPQGQRYLKNICNNILLLKYLSLRGTDVDRLPNEINYLHELEVLDIQQTKVPEKATRGLLLLKLKRLLAGHSNATPNSTSAIGTSFPSHVLVPEKIEKMLDMEVLCNVKVQSKKDLIDIGKLWQLRKLGVVIKDKDNHVNNLLRLISDLHECLRSLSIAIDTTSFKGTPNINLTELKNSPKFLERLSISGDVLQGQLLPILLDKAISTKLIKITLSRTSLSQSNLDKLSKLPMLRCLRLRHNKYTDKKLSFKDFQKLTYFLVESSERIEISFEDKSAPELKKIVLFLDNIESIAGVEQFKKLEELELNNNNKTSNISGGTTAATANNPASSAPGPAAATKPAPSAVAVANHALSTAPTASVSTNPSPSAPTVDVVVAAINLASSAPAVDHAPSTASTVTATATATNPSPSAPSTAVVIEHVSSTTPTTTAATDPSPSAPTADVTSAAINLASSAPTAGHTPSTTPTVIVTINPSPSTPTADAAAAAIDLTSSSPAIAAPFTTAAAVAPGLDLGANTNPTPAVAATDHTPSTLAATTTTNPSPFAPATADSATTNDLVPSTATDPTPSALTATDATTTPAPPTTSNGNMLFSKLLTSAKQIKKVTLRGTMLKQHDLQSLASMPNIRCLVLLDKSCHESQIALSKDGFPKLNVLIVDCSTIIEIKFDIGSSPKLEKIIWTVTNLNFPGVENLPRLKELEFKGDYLPVKMKKVINKHKDRISYTHHKPESQDQSVKNKGEEDKGVQGCPLIWKGKGWHRRN